MVRYGVGSKQEYFSYIHNLQGDVLGIIDREQELVVEYTYDPWGKPLATSPRQLSTNIPPEDGETEEQTAERLALIDLNSRLNNLYQSLASLNPFRYRGYQFDDESGLYYLRTRYYSPQMNRFVSEDSFGGNAGNLLSHNMFAYCKNTPTMMVDKSGNTPEGYVTQEINLENFPEACFLNSQWGGVIRPNVGWAYKKEEKHFLSYEYLNNEQAQEFIQENLVVDWYTYFKMGFDWSMVVASEKYKDHAIAKYGNYAGIALLCYETISLEEKIEKSDLAQKMLPSVSEGQGVKIERYYINNDLGGFVYAKVLPWDTWPRIYLPSRYEHSRLTMSLYHKPLK